MRIIKNSVAQIEVDIVCPLYKGFKLFSSLFETFKEQKNVIIKNVILPITDSEDEDTKNTIQFAIDNNLSFFIVKKMTISLIRCPSRSP